MRAGSGRRTLRVALLGFGDAGRILHAPLVASTEGLELGAIVTRDPARGRAARMAYPDVAILGNADEVWPGGFDLVILATPSGGHAGLAERAIAAGLATVVDKPLTTTVASAERVVALARAAGVPLTVFQNRRWDSDFRTLRRVLAEGRLGRPLRLEARFEVYRPVDRSRWQESPVAADGGSVLVDFGSHRIDQAVLLFGRPLTVSAEIHRRRPGSAVDDDVFMSLAFAGGVTAHLWLSRTAHASGPAFRLLGSDAAFEIDGSDRQWSALGRGERPGGRGWGRHPTVGRITIEDGPDEGTRTVRPLAGAYPQFYAAVRDALLDGGPMPVDPADAVEVLRVIEAAETSAREGRVVTLAPPSAG
jgi:predicted dehydrogenase